jgi:tetratricopeptide (TPR) repeat protein
MASLHTRAKAAFLAALTPPPPNRASESVAGAPRRTVGAGSEQGGGGPVLPGTLFAGRYRMVTCLGRGGLGEVWRADDLVVATPVALKIIDSITPEIRERILEEVRLARRITHPAVCRVFDVGETEGCVFYSMELIDGEDVATLLRRLGRLPAEKVAEIGHQLCEGLGAAHAQGVLHRDLKPANVLIDDKGCVRITDFGINATRDDADSQAGAGAPGYKAPEQLVPGAVVSARADLFALGLVLYELLVGRRPFNSAADVRRTPVRPSTLVPDVHPPLERAILKALRLDPARRPASASDMAEMLRGGGSRWTASRILPWIGGAAIAAAVAGLAALSPVLMRPAARPLTDRDRLVIADFLNTTGEPVFDGSLKVALAVALDQSPFLKVFPDDRVRDTLRLMQRDPSERITRPIAREIAQREQLTALVAGSIASLGSNYVLALEAVNADSGDVMAREQVEVPRKEDLLAALGKAATNLRKKLGESLASVQRFDVALPRATTGSLDALHAYSLSLDQGREVPRVEAIPHLERAIALDPNFAMAYARLSGVYANNGRSADAPVFSRKAFELRDRVSERERFFISWRYFLDAEQAWDKALELAHSWTVTYPREAFAFNSLGLASAAFGQHDEAVRAFREAIRLDPKFVPPHGNLAGSLIASNRHDEAKAVLREATKQGVDFITLRRMLYTLAVIDDDGAAQARELDLARATHGAIWAAVWEARASRFSGRVAAAHELFQRGVEMAVRDQQRELGAQSAAEDAETHAIAGQCGDALREVPAALALSRDNFTVERASRTLALCGRADDAQRLAAELAERYATASLTQRIQRPVTAAAVAVQHGQPARAVELLDRVTPYDQAPASEFWPAYLRGQALLQLKDARSAGAQFQSILDRRGQAPTSPLYPLACLGRARAHVLAGEREPARRAYERFFTLWTGADPALESLQAARREYARLSQ